MTPNLTYKLNEISNIDDPLILSIKIFNPSKEKTLKYHNKEDWLNKIKDKGILISVYDDDKCIAFAICYKTNSDTLHIWNVGVLDEYRGLGIWRETYNRIIDYAIKQGFKKITLNTYKDKFPNMYAFVKKESFDLIKEEFNKDGEMKSCFVKRVR